MLYFVIANLSVRGHFAIQANTVFDITRMLSDSFVRVPKTVCKYLPASNVYQNRFYKFVILVLM